MSVQRIWRAVGEHPVPRRARHRRRPLQRSPPTAIRQKEPATAASRRRRRAKMAARPSRAREVREYGQRGPCHCSRIGDRFVEHPVPRCARPPPPTSPSPADAAVAANRNSSKRNGDGGQQAAAAARSDGGAPLTRARSDRQWVTRRTDGVGSRRFERAPAATSAVPSIAEILSRRSNRRGGQFATRQGRRTYRRCPHAMVCGT